jgi:hypothetical protein
MEVLEIDGSRREGGGQMVRTSVAMSTVTGRTVHLTRIRENRPTNGLYKQHCAAVNAVAQMAGLFLLIFGGVVVVSSDLGSASIILCIFLTMFFALGVKLYWFALGGAGIAAVVPLLWNHFLKPYQKNRLLAPYDPSIDPKNDGINWQTYQSKVTLASGRITGVDSEHRLTAFTGKHTDFIFSCIGEELGMIGCIIVVVLLVIIIIHCARVGLKSGRTFDMLVMHDDATTDPFKPEDGYEWFADHAADYGFIVRFPEDKSDLTGERARTYTYRYVGVPHAKYMTKHGLCLEEYIDALKGYTIDKPLEVEGDGCGYRIYYVPAPKSGKIEVLVPEKERYTVSGNNSDGFIVTVTTK